VANARRPWVRRTHRPPDAPVPTPDTFRAAPRGWSSEAWALRVALFCAGARLDRESPLARLLEGVERWVRLGGCGRPAPGTGSAESKAWWRHALVLVRAVGVVSDDSTRMLLSQWLTAKDPAEAEDKFKPFGS
jgi:hypothetical protein